MLGARALPDFCPGVVWWFDRWRLGRLELLVFVGLPSPKVPLLATPSPCTTYTGVETARCLGWPPPLLQQPLSLSLPLLPVLDPAPPAESCCVEGNLSTIPVACLWVGVAATGCSAFINDAEVEPIPCLRWPMSLPWFNCLLLRWPLPVPRLFDLPSPTESCCVEGDLSTMLAVCPQLGGTSTGYSAW